MKPVLFAHLAPFRIAAESGSRPNPLAWAPPPESKVALVLDLPGDEGVVAALGLAAGGYRPVPLYNAIPPPLMPPGHRAHVAVDVEPIVAGLAQGASILASCSVPPDAPPAFLLDAQRRGLRRWMTLQPVTFENRSVCFPSDFPSATFLQEAGITWVLLVQKSRLEPRPDLAEVLQGWKDGGLFIDAVRLDEPFRFVECPIRPRSALGRAWRHFVDLLELRRNPAGGFGRKISSGTGG